MPNLTASQAIVTGAIGSGKSTVVRAVMAQMGWDKPAGFFTHWGGAERPAPEIFIEPWSGGGQVMAHQLPARTGPDGLPYALNREPFTHTAIASLYTRPGPVVVDELGVLELGATEFAAAFAKVFHGPASVLVVIQERALSRWQVLLDPDGTVPVFRVEPETRESLPAEMVRALRA